MQSSKILLKDGKTTVDLVDNRIDDSDIETWNSKMDKQTVGNVSEPVYLENGIAKVATNVVTDGRLNTKLNVDGSNATKDGVTAMMKKVATGSAGLDDDSTYFGDSNDDHTHIMRRPILNIWVYIKEKVKTLLLGSVGSVDKPIYLENGVPKVATNVATIGNLDEKLNVDGSNATNAGVTAMMKKVSSGTDTLDDDSSYFGDSNDDHTHIVRRPILNLWNYIEDKVETKLGSVGDSSKPIYLKNGVPKVCDDGVPYSFYNYGDRVGYGVFVGGNTKLSKSTRCYCTFLVSISSNPDLMLHTYIGSFSFRGDFKNKVLNNELRCLTGAPQYPLRMTVVYNEDGKDSNGNPTYSVGLYVIPARKTDKYSTYRLTRIAHSGFIWNVKNISDADYDNCDTSPGTKSASTVIVSSDAVFKSISKSESITNGCTLKFGATDGSSKSITVKYVVEADKIDGYHISVGSTVGTDPNTIYIVNAT